jgi:hypothetical protein
MPPPPSSTKESARELPLCTFCMAPHATTDDFCPRCAGPVGGAATAGAFESIRAEYWLLGRQGPPRWMLRTAFLFILAGSLAQFAFFGGALLDQIHESKTIVGVLTAAFGVGWLFLTFLVVRFTYRRWWKQPATAPEID